MEGEGEGSRRLACPPQRLQEPRALGWRTGRVGRHLGSSTGSVSPPGGAVTAAASGWLAPPVSSSLLQPPPAGLEGARGRRGLELELFTLHLVLATSSLEGFISTCLCLSGFLEAKRSISAMVTPPWAWNIQRRGAHYHSP